MTYSNAIDYLFGLQKFGIKLGLRNITMLLDLLGNPHHRLRCVHVAGSNGKGSTAAVLQAILSAHGYRCGLYTSPHLVDFTERIRIGTAEIPRAEVARRVRRIRGLCRKAPLQHITFFEAITALALEYFADQGTEAVIVETGLGGRWDATNVIEPQLCVITTISLEHQQYLGRTRAAIARDKAGIIKPGRPVVCGVREPMLRNLFQDAADRAGAPLFALGRDFRCRSVAEDTFSYQGHTWRVPAVHCGLAGTHQHTNAALALRAVEALGAGTSLRFAPETAAAAVAGARWPGRLETIAGDPPVLLDGAHNPAGWRVLRDYLQQTGLVGRIVLLAGFSADKDVRAFMRDCVPLARTCVFCPPDVQRAAGKSALEQHVRFDDRDGPRWCDSAAEALYWARTRVRPGETLCVTGSLFVVGAVRQILNDAADPALSGRIAM